MASTFMLLLIGSSLRADCVSEIRGEHEFDFASVIFSEKDTTRLSQRVQLRSACEYFDLRKNHILYKSRKEANQSEQNRQRDVYSEVAVTRDAIGWRPGSSAVEKTYSGKIQNVALEPNPVLRMKAVYQLVNQYRGTYKPYEWDGWPSPGKTLTKAASTGSGGVCRDFSSLLVWSLNQVARGPAGRAEFSVQTKHLPEHALVTVRLFREPGARSDADQRFSLDPTNYLRFTPLPLPDLESPDEVLRDKFDRCQALYKCMSVLDFPELGSSQTKRAPNPAP